MCISLCKSILRVPKYNLVLSFLMLVIRRWGVNRSIFPQQFRNEFLPVDILIFIFFYKTLQILDQRKDPTPCLLYSTVWSDILYTILNNVVVSVFEWLEYFINKQQKAKTILTLIPHVVIIRISIASCCVVTRLHICCCSAKQSRIYHAI